MADVQKIYVPKQTVRRGVAGYKGKDVIVVDANGDEKPAEKSGRKSK